MEATIRMPKDLQPVVNGTRLVRVATDLWIRPADKDFWKLKKAEDGKGFVIERITDDEVFERDRPPDPGKP
jgi:hypothetical protein